MLAIGDRLPDVELIDQDGEPVRLHDRVGPRVLVVYFYPKDETPGCTIEACGFRDTYTDFVGAGAEVIGISSDSADSHRRFRDRHDLPFTLLSDPAGAAQRAFGVSKTLGLLPGRVTFVIDRQGRIEHVFNSQVRARKHVASALKVVRRLRLT
jgi:peroxiredoxin Q/BCP